MEQATASEALAPVARKNNRKKSGKSPTQNSLARLRDEGYRVHVTEKWNPHARIRQDMFGFVDVLAIRDGETLAVQCCARGSVSTRINKIVEECAEALADVRAAGWRIEVHGWDKDPKTGRYRVRIEDIS